MVFHIDPDETVGGVDDTGEVLLEDIVAYL
jgi:hypothetical protein